MKSKLLCLIFSILLFILVFPVSVDALNCSVYDNYKFYKYPKMIDSDWEYIQNYIDATGHDLRNGYFIDNQGNLTYNSTFITQEILKDTSWNLARERTFIEGYNDGSYMQKKINGTTYGVIYVFFRGYAHPSPANCNITDTLVVIQYNEQLFVRETVINRTYIVPATAISGHAVFMNYTDDIWIDYAYFRTAITRCGELRVIWTLGKTNPTTIYGTTSDFGDFSIDTCGSQALLIKTSDTPYSLSSWINCYNNLNLGSSSYMNTISNSNLQYATSTGNNTLSNHSYFGVMHVSLASGLYYYSTVPLDFNTYSFNNTPISLSDSEAIQSCEQANPLISHETPLNLICDAGVFLTGSSREGGCLVVSLFILAIAISIIGRTFHYYEEKYKKEISNRYIITGAIAIIMIVITMMGNLTDLFTGIISIFVIIALLLVFEERAISMRR